MRSFAIDAVIGSQLAIIVNATALTQMPFNTHAVLRAGVPVGC